MYNLKEDGKSMELSSTKCNAFSFVTEELKEEEEEEEEEDGAGSGGGGVVDIIFVPSACWLSPFFLISIFWVCVCVCT